MHPDPLPDDSVALARLLADVRTALSASRDEVDRLSRLADRPEGPRPLTLHALPEGARVGVAVFKPPGGKFSEPTVFGVINPLNSGAEVNDSLSAIAGLALPLFKRLPLSVSDRLHLERLARDGGSPSADSKGGRSLLLECMIRSPGDPPLAEEVVESNQTKVAALLGLFERLTSALKELSALLERKLHPPEVKDRVRVDVEKRVLTIDGLDYKLNTREQARVLEQMAKENGEPLEGPEIARRAGLREGFMISRTLNQIKKKHPKLSKLIPLVSDAGNMFCLRLPPLS